MSSKLKYKIISCSSQQSQHPVSSLLFNNAQGWQTKRFCTYPQEVTLEFYGIANIKKIQMLSDHRKISSQVDILYYLPSVNRQNKFLKYGYLNFSRNETNGSIKQLKTITVDLNCQYLRFLLHKPHSSRENFFSQIGLVQLSVYGSSGNLPQNDYGEQQQNEQVMNEEDDAYIRQRIAEMDSLKKKAVLQENFDDAEYYKKAEEVIVDLGGKLKQKRAVIQDLIEKEDYDRAKKVKEDIYKIKDQINDILQEKPYEEEQKQPENQFYQENQFAEPQMQQFIDHPQRQSRVKNIEHSMTKSKVSQLAQSRRIKHMQNIQNSPYDERVVPTLLGKQKTEEQEQEEQNVKPEFELLPVDNKFIKESLLIQEFYDQEVAKKFFSKHWQHKVEGLETIQSQLRQKPKDMGFLRCLVTIVNFSVGESNFQVSQHSLAVLQEMLKINREGNIATKPGEIQNDLDQISREVIKKFSDNNGKVRGLAEKCFEQMSESDLYGVDHCAASLIKSKGKLSVKQLQSRLSMIEKMIQKHGVGSGHHLIPLSAVDFAIELLNNPAGEIRNQSISLLHAAYQKDKDKIDSRIALLKANIREAIQEGHVKQEKHMKKK